MTRFSVAGGKIDERASFLAAPFFPAKNSDMTRLIMDNRVGDQLGNYRLTRLLGTSGQADVYMGEHLYLESQAAIKVLHTALADEAVARFLVEAQHLVGLTHPHIVRVLDFAVERNVPFLVMEYAPSGSLRGRYPKGSYVPLTDIVSYVQQVTDALQYIHDKILVHRDIKPENLLLLSDYEIVLSDFGISAIAHPTDSVILRGQAGTPAYMAPEQIRKMPCPASDQYSVGIVVYEWLCGACPFQGNEFDILQQHLHMPPPPLREQVPTIPPALEEVVLKALSKDPQHRFANVRVFATALQQATQEIWHVRTVSLSYQSVSSDKEETLLAQSEAVTTPLGSSSPTSVVPPPIQGQLSGPSSQRAIPDQISLTPPITGHSYSSTTPSFPPFLLKPSSNEEANIVSHRRFSRGNLFLLLGVLILFLGSSVSIFYFTHRNQQTPNHPQHSVVAGGSTTTTGTADVAATATIIAANPNPYPPYRGKLVLYDPLRDNKDGNKWVENSDPSVGTACTFIGGAYHVIMPPNYGGPCFAEATDFSDFTYQVQLTFVKEAPNWSGGGIVFRGDGNNYYYFEIFESGRYTFDGCAGNDCTLQLASGLGPNQVIQAFHTGLNQPNILAVVAIGDTFSVYVNGQHIVGPVSNNAYRHGMIGVFGEGGFDVNHFNNTVSETEVVYRDVKVWQL